MRIGFFRKEKASYYVIMPSLSSKVIEEVMGDAFVKVLGWRPFSAQQKAKAERFQLCHSHKLRDLEYAKESGDKDFAPRMKELLLRSQKLWKESGEISQEEFEGRKRCSYEEFGLLMEEEVCHLEGKDLQDRYRKHGDKLFTFLEVGGVLYDNNGSEQDLRNNIVHQKVTGGLRSDLEAKVCATNCNCC